MYSERFLKILITLVDVAPQRKNSNKSKGKSNRKNAGTDNTHPGPILSVLKDSLEKKAAEKQSVQTTSGEGTPNSLQYSVSVVLTNSE